MHGKTVQTSLKVTTLGEAKRVVKESGIAKLEQTAKVTKLTSTVVAKLTTGGNLTWAKAIEHYTVAMQSKARASKTVHNNLCVIKAWLREMKLEDTTPSLVTEKEIARWINAKDSTASAGTRKVNLAAIRTMFEFLCDRGWIAGNPANLVAVDYSVMTHEQKETAERVPFTDAEVKKLLAHIKAKMTEATAGLTKLMASYKKQTILPLGAIRFQERIDYMRFWDFAIRLSHETGLRLGDICQLQWENFSKPGIIALWMDKTNNRVEVPVSDAILELASNIPVDHNKFLFPQQRETITDEKKRSLLSVQFRRLCEAAKVTGKSFHCLRHTVASKQYAEADKEKLATKLAEMMTVGQIAALLGHANVKTTKGYVHE
jgi:integrase